MKLYKSWQDFKAIIDRKKIPIRYIETNLKYIIWFHETNDEYKTEIYKSSDNIDLQDFENNYKADANKSIRPLTKDGKEIVRAESRPLNTITCFLGQADSDTEIGKGKILEWDFSNGDDIIDMGSGATEKRKRLEFKFIDSIWIKEGTVYFFNAVKGSYIDFYVVCPAGQYYYDNNGNPKLATEDTPISHYVSHCRIQGSVPMGDELNTESCSSEIPSNYKFWIEITVPDTDNSSNGYIQLELYRERTIIL